MKNRAANCVVRMTSVGVSAIALIWGFVEPKSVVTGPSQPPTVESAVHIPAVGIADTAPDALLERAAERDPFTSANRIETASTATAPAAIASEQPLRVLGTVVDSVGGSFALCQLGATQAVIVRVGQRIGAYGLQRVGKGSAVFTMSNGDSVELRVPRAGA